MLVAAADPATVAAAIVADTCASAGAIVLDAAHAENVVLTRAHVRCIGASLLPSKA